MSNQDWVTLFMYVRTASEPLGLPTRYHLSCNHRTRADAEECAARWNADNLALTPDFSGRYFVANRASKACLLIDARPLSAPRRGDAI